MNTMVVVYVPANEAEADALASMLRDQEIHVEVQSNHDTALNGLYQSQVGWGEIRARPEDAERARDLVREWLASAPRVDADDEMNVEREPPIARSRHFFTKAWRWVSPVLLLSSIGMNFWLLRKDPRYSDKIEQRDTAGRLSTIYKYRGQSEFPYKMTSYSTEETRLAEFEDADENGRAERATDYSERGTKLREFLDRDQNGRFETTLIYHLDKVIGRLDDRDEDGITESATWLVGGRTVAVESDTNGDGRFDQATLYGPEAKPQATLRDSGSGFYDEVSCADSTGRRLVFRLRECRLLP